MKNAFPKSHLFLACVLALPLGSFLMASSNPTDDDRFTTELVLDQVKRADLPAHKSLDLDIAPGDMTASMGSLPRSNKANPQQPPVALHESIEKVRKGDNLAVIFKRLNIPARDLQKILATGATAKRLTQIYPGHQLNFARDDAGTLVKLNYAPGPLETLTFQREGDHFIASEETRKPDRLRTYRHGVIDHSLFVASQRLGLDDDLTMRLAQIFQWDVDFVLDIRKGDSFSVLYEELMLGDKLIGYGDILAAEFVNQGQSYRAVLYRDAQGNASYYNPAGDSMRKAFLRAPVEFSRISSNFNMKRMHPLHKTIKPHRGIDYVAPRGTPILAAGDGKVKIASRTKANGKYIVLQHGQQFQTKYLHLSNFARGVKSGARVHQGQVIGYVGSTGWATGAHLHYEFLVNGVHRNPRTVKLPKAKPIPENQLASFQRASLPLLALLESYKEQQQIAAAQ